MSRSVNNTSDNNIGAHKEAPYPHPRIWINGRNVNVEKIVSEAVTPQSAFEETTFAFIRSWLSGETQYTLTTSGSTGVPKKITITREQMITSAVRTAAKIGVEKNMTALICLDTQFIGGKMMLARSLFFGLRILAVDPCANPLIKIPVDKWVQFTALVPYQVTSILESKHPHLLNNLESVLIGGAPLHPRDIARLQNFQCACYETYGMTETISHIALKLVNTPTQQQYFETLKGITLSTDTRGCLVIESDYLPEPVVTNDLIELVGPGQFRWLGRADNVINTGGIKVIPETLEAQLQEIFMRHGIDNRFFIAALPDDKLGNRIALIIEGSEVPSEPLRAALSDFREAVTPYEFPREIYSASPFVTAGNDKVDRKRTLDTAALLMPTA